MAGRGQGGTLGGTLEREGDRGQVAGYHLRRQASASESERANVRGEINNLITKRGGRKWARREHVSWDRRQKEKAHSVEKTQRIGILAAKIGNFHVKIQCWGPT